MITINSNVDLGKAFQSLLDSMKMAEEKRESESNLSMGYAASYGWLRGAVAAHIQHCTGINVYADTQNVPAANQDDLKDLKI